MKKDDLIRFRHMKEAAQESFLFIQGKSQRDLHKDRMLTLALMKCFEIIGEAASKVSSETRSKYPQFPWAEIIGMRNRLIHAYFDINLQLVWDTIQIDLPLLMTLLDNILSQENDD